MYTYCVYLISPYCTCTCTRNSHNSHVFVSRDVASLSRSRPRLSVASTRPPERLPPPRETIQHAPVRKHRARQPEHEHVRPVRLWLAHDDRALIADVFGRRPRRRRRRRPPRGAPAPATSNCRCPPSFGTTTSPLGSVFTNFGVTNATKRKPPTSTSIGFGRHAPRFGVGVELKGVRWS